MPVATAAALVWVALASPPATGGAAATPGGSAVAASTPVTGGGSARGRVILRLEGPFPATLATLAESDLRTAFGRRGVEVTRRDGGAAGAPTATPGPVAAPTATPGPVTTGTPPPPRELVLTVVAAGERLEQLSLTLEGAGASTLTRRLNLTPVPPDGRVLALVVAADEMLVASADHRLPRSGGGAATESASPAGGPSAAPAAEAERGPQADASADADARPRPEPPAPPPLVTVAIRTGPPSPPWPRTVSTLSAAFALDHFAGGQTQLGFDLAWRRRVGAHAYGLLAAQGRQGLVASSPTGSTVATRLLGGRLAAGLGLIDEGGPLWLGVDVGARAGRLWLDGRPTATVVGHDVGTFMVYADAMLTLDVRLGRSPLAVRLALGAGLPILAQVAAEASASPAPGTASASTAVTAASGAAFESQGGVVLSF